MTHRVQDGSPESKPRAWFDARWARVGRVVVSVVAVVVGTGFVLLTLAVGGCCFAGGCCPMESSFDEDTFRLAATGAAIAVGIPVLLNKPSWKRLIVALISAVVAGVLIGLLATGATA
jgi:hypothetical protein